MKDFLKIIGIIFVGLFSAVIIYPILHEVGHSLIALIVGAKVVEFNLFPLPNVMCDVLNVENTGLVAIGLGGIIIPYLVSFILKPNLFWIWYANTIVRGISLLALVISVVSIIMWLNGNIVQNEDIVQVLTVFNDGARLFLIIFALMIIYGVIRIITDKPLITINEYFS